MTEAEWLSCADPAAMLRHVCDGARASQRQLRLFGAACCRRVWLRLTDPRSRRAVEVAERYADGAATIEQLAAASEGAWDAHLGKADAEYYAALAAYYSVNNPHSPDAEDVSDAAIRSSYLDPDDPEVEDRIQAALCRDVFGNPFRSPPTLDATCFSSGLVALAERIYAEQEFGLMPTLADALEEADCKTAEVLAHCREPGEHARGCWALDAILAKT